MYCIKRIQYGENKHNNYLTESRVLTTRDLTEYSKNQHGIYVPNKDSIMIGNTRQDTLVPTYSYTKYPYERFTNKISLTLNSKFTNSKEDAEVNTQKRLLKITEKIREAIKKSNTNVG